MSRKEDYCHLGICIIAFGQFSQRSLKLRVIGRLDDSCSCHCLHFICIGGGMILAIFSFDGKMPVDSD